MNSTDIQTIQKDIKDYLSDLLNDQDLTTATKLIETGAIDSLNLINLILYIEKAYQVKVKVFHAQVDHFQTIESIAEFIKNNLGKVS